ncbi:MAG: hypothetical protein ACI82F_000999 [Planctomycetota bacterium]|jgi:hypothetical protein
MDRSIPSMDFRDCDVAHKAREIISRENPPALWIPQNN